ncbi:hypothetical protein Tsubulata_004466, partial [Turnera subulata]
MELLEPEPLASSVPVVNYLGLMKVQPQFALSYNALSDCYSATIHFLGYIHGYLVDALHNLAGTHPFLHTHMVTLLHLRVEYIYYLVVFLGSGKRISYIGFVKLICTPIQGLLVIDMLGSVVTIYTTSWLLFMHYVAYMEGNREVPSLYLVQFITFCFTCATGAILPYYQLAWLSSFEPKDHCPLPWMIMLSWAKCIYSNCYMAIKLFFFELLYGLLPSLVLHYVEGNSTKGLELAQMVQQGAMLYSLKQNSHHVQHQLTMFTQKHRSELAFAMGDYVYSWFGPSHLLSVHFQHHYKFVPNLLCPPQLRQCASDVTSKVQLAETAHIHSLLHASLYDVVSRLQIVLHLVNSTLDLVLQLIDILQQPCIQPTNCSTEQWLVPNQDPPLSVATLANQDQQLHHSF